MILIAAFMTTVAAVPIVAATHEDSDGDKVAFWRDAEARREFEVDNPDAECRFVVPGGGTAACTDTWNQQAGEYKGDWHTVFHPDVLGFVDTSIGRIDMKIKDDVGETVFSRSCVWFGPASLSGTGGLCSISYHGGNHSVGEPGEWTMVVRAYLDGSVLSSEAHAQFGLVPR